MRPSPHQALVRFRSLISPHAFLRRMSLPGSAHHQRSSDILTSSHRDAPREGSLWTGRRMWECFHVLRLSYYLIPGAESRVEDTAASNTLLVSPATERRSRGNIFTTYLREHNVLYTSVWDGPLFCDIHKDTSQTQSDKSCDAWAREETASYSGVSVS